MSIAYARLRNINRQSRLVFGIIQKRGPITRSELMDITKMKLNTLKRTMQPLLDEGFIVEADTGKSTGGRPPVLYDVNTKDYYVAGIDISRTYFSIVITNLKMEILDIHFFPAPSDPIETVCQIYRYFSSALKRLSFDKSNFIGVGIGTVGPVDSKKGVMLNPANFATSGWINVPIKDMVQQKFQLPALVDNGANAAVLAEHFFGIGREINDIAYFNCGIGIRTGAISSNTLVSSVNYYEDAFGHMTIDIDGELCHCGNRGCIEAYCSIPSIVKKFILELKKGRPSLVKKDLDKITYMDICTAAENGDSLAREVIINTAKIFGTGLANYINILNPQLVILSGPLAMHSPLFFEISVQTALKKMYVKNDGFAFSRGGYFKQNAIAVGAAVEFLEEVLLMQ